MRESLNCLEQTFSRNLDFEDTVSAGTKRSEEHVTEKRGFFLCSSRQLSNTSAVTWTA